jgi:tetratricopeptide (TPR) repeat protein
MQINISYLLSQLILMTVVLFSEAQSVHTSYSQVTIPTYPWRGKDDINPPFRQTNNPSYSPYTTTYPYPTQDNLSKTKEDVTYQTMVLENEYLKVEVIPDMGGHVHAIYDKLTGRSIVYDNKVVKPALIGLRGAWTAGGIEFNTGPQGHTVTCLSPVEAKFIDYPDGSKGIAIGNVEQVYHTQWAVTLRLRPGKDFLEEHIRIYNPADEKHLYYFWNCVAVENTDSLQLIYPMTLGSDHWGKTFYHWPVEKGVDKSWMKNYEFPSSIFAYRCDQDFYGSYDHALDQGLIAYANHYELEGKKSWTWGHGKWGGLFQACLRDDSTGYNEIQTGPMGTQADYGILNPHQTVEWDEWWYPVRGTKGVAFSNKDVTVNVFRDDKKNTASLLINGTSKRDATCTIEGMGEQPIKISPDKAANAIFFGKNLKDTLHIKISADKNILAEFTWPLSLPVRTAPENPRELPSENTAAGCWLHGVQAWREGGNHVAKDWFEKAIGKDSSFSDAITSLAQIEMDAGQYETAKKHLERSIKLNPDDGWAMYYLAQANLQLGFVPDALEMAYHAARYAESKSAAYSLAGSILLRKGEFAEAVVTFRQALDYNAPDLASRDLLAFALWKSGQSDEALKELQQVLSRDALDMPAAAIQYLMGKEDKDFYTRIAGRMEETLDLADFFIAAGLHQEASALLKHYYMDAAKKEPAPMVYYYYGILNKDKAMLQQTMSMNPDYVFPNSLVAASILKEAIETNPSDWKSKYYLGNFLFERSDKEGAVKLWKDALAINSSYSVVHRNLGLCAWKLDKNYWQAIREYEKAIQCNPDDITLYRDLASIYVENTQQYQEAKVLLEKLMLEKKCSRADIVSLLTRAYNFMGDYDKAIQLLVADNYMNWEGKGSLYSIYTDAHLGKGEQLFRQGNYEAAQKEFQAAIDYPNNLGPGLTENPETARSRYWIGLALQKSGKKDDALKEWKLAAAEAEKGSEENKKFALEAKEEMKEGD